MKYFRQASKRQRQQRAAQTHLEVRRRQITKEPRARSTRVVRHRCEPAGSGAASTGSRRDFVIGGRSSAVLGGVGCAATRGHRPKDYQELTDFSTEHSSLTRVICCRLHVAKRFRRSHLRSSDTHDMCSARLQRNTLGQERDSLTGAVNLTNSRNSGLVRTPSTGSAFQPHIGPLGGLLVAAPLLFSYHFVCTKV